MKRNILLSLTVVGALSISTVTPLKAAPDADNSGKNVVDRNSETITPESQSNAKEDVEVTAAIRRAIVKNDSLSTYAHNIKIVTTENHVVYLRGPVASAEEVATIVKLAKQNAGKYPVKNQLSVNRK